MPMSRRTALGIAASSFLVPRLARAATSTLKVGTLQFGTVMWELDVIKHHALDRDAGYTLEVQPFGGNDAADVALMGRAVDAIVEDWLWVSRQRSDGAMLTFIPYSSSIGALMVRGDSPVQKLEDLAGKKLGIAGGPLDKSWLIVQGYARQTSGIEIAAEAESVYASPPLLNEKLLSGELDGIINYWNWSARLEAAGHRRLLGVAEAMETMGVPADTPQLGYVLHEGWADANAPTVKAFAASSRAAKEILKTSDEEWERLRPLTRAEDDATLEAFKRRYREGIIESWGEEERAAAERLFEILAQLGGRELVGDATTLAPGTFWAGVSY
jgi:NitT/TauT family transport system substrate-binding protein